MSMIFRSLFVIAAVAAIAGGATFAYFTSEASITGSTFSAGTLDLKIDKDASRLFQNWVSTFAAPSPFLEKMKPGDKGEQILDIMNQGSIDGVNATIKFVRTSAADQLRNNLKFTVFYDADNDGPLGWVSVATGTLAQFEGNTYPLGNLNAGKKASVKILWEIPTSAGNDIQGDSVTINTVFGLEQVR